MLMVRSAMQALQAPAAAASAAMLVPPGFLPRAVGLSQTVQALMTVAAAPLGALAISVLPMGWALGIDVGTALLGIVPLLFLRIPQPRVAREDRQGLWREALAAPVGLALASPLGEAIGIRWLLVVIGVAGTLVSLSGFLSPALRNLDRPAK